MSNERYSILNLIVKNLRYWRDRRTLGKVCTPGCCIGAPSFASVYFSTALATDVPAAEQVYCRVGLTLKIIDFPLPVGIIASLCLWVNDLFCLGTAASWSIGILYSYLHLIIKCIDVLQRMRCDSWRSNFHIISSIKNLKFFEIVGVSLDVMSWVIIYIQDSNILEYKWIILNPLIVLFPRFLCFFQTILYWEKSSFNSWLLRCNFYIYRSQLLYLSWFTQCWI